MVDTHFYGSICLVGGFFDARRKMGMRRSQVNTVSSNAKCPDALSWFSTAEAFSSIVNETSGILGNLPSGFAGTLEYHLKRLRITNSKLVNSGCAPELDLSTSLELCVMSYLPETMKLSHFLTQQLQKWYSQTVL